MRGELLKTERLLEDLEVLIESSSRIPMTTTKRMVEEDEIMRIIDSIQSPYHWNLKNLVLL